MFSDYLDAYGLVVVGVCILAILLSRIFNGKVSVSSVTFPVIFIVLFISYGWIKQQASLLDEDYLEIKKTLQLYTANKSLIEENTSDQKTLSELEIILVKKTATYKDLELINYAILRDKVNLKIYNQYSRTVN